MRAKLGLKPLQVENQSQSSAPKAGEAEPSGNKKYIDEKTSTEFEHVPASNIADLKQQKELRKKLEEQREKRKLLEK